MAVRLRVPGYNPGGPVLPRYADNGMSASGGMNGQPLPDGQDTDENWVAASFGYTGDAMKATAGSGRIFALLDLSDKLAGDPTVGIGHVEFEISALPESNGLLMLIAGYADTSNYMAFGVQAVGGINTYRYFRRSAGSDTGATSIAGHTPTVGDVIELHRVSGSGGFATINGETVISPTNVPAATGIWGVLGNFSQDPTSEYANFKYDS